MKELKAGIIPAGYAWPSAQASDTLRSAKSDAASTVSLFFVCDYIMTLLPVIVESPGVRSRTCWAVMLSVSKLCR